MPHRKNVPAQEPVERMRDLLSQLKDARHGADDVASDARREVGHALRGSGLEPAGRAPAARATKKGRKKR